MVQAKAGDTVKVHYTGKLTDGTVFDSSFGNEPLRFTIGEGQVIPGFEHAAVGMDLGQSKTVTIPAEEAYGPHVRELVMIFAKEQIPPELSVEIGQQLQLHQDNGNPIPVVVTEVSDAEITLDANHPLAGEDLTFDLELVSID
ncbi:MAG: FKBP-type peptidyl-prolyl cis-trans isomerase [Xenococcaceae cyanobacterium]